MKEGYLQTKISSNEDELKKLMTRVDKLESQNQELTAEYFKISKNAVDEVYKRIEQKIIVSLIADVIVRERNELYKLRNKFVNTLNNADKQKAKVQIRIHDALVDEMFLTRQTLGFLSSILIDKKIISLEELTEKKGYYNEWSKEKITKDVEHLRLIKTR